MKTLVFQGPGEMTLEDRPAPVAADDEVLARVVASGICGSELEAYSGRSAKRRPGLIFGHEFVVAVDGEPGLFVVDPLTPCGACDLCRSGRTNLCPDRSLLSLHTDGGNREFIPLDRSQLLPWPGDATLGTLVEPGATVLRALGTVDELTRGPIAVFGCGALGLLGVLFARHLGIERVYAFDPLAPRLDLAIRFGATPFAPDDPSLGCALVLDTVGAASSRAAAIRHTASGGAVGLVGLRDATSEVDFGDIISRGIRLTGEYAYTRADLLRAAQILLATESSAREILTTMPFATGTAAFSAAVKSPEEYIKIVLTMDR